MAQPEYIGVKDMDGPFVLVENVSGVGYGSCIGDILIRHSVKKRLLCRFLPAQKTLFQIRQN